jgi:orotate phosphoribosyltransferase
MYPYEYQISGLETAAIILVTGMAMETGMNGFYIRKSRKKHGLYNMIEGRLSDAPVIIVDDLMNS